MRKKAFPTPVYPRFTPSSHALPCFRSLNQFIHAFPVCPCFISPRSPMFYPRLSTFIPISHVLSRLYLFLPQVIQVSFRSLLTPVYSRFNCLHSMLTPVYPRSYPFTYVYSLLSSFYPVYRCLRQLIHVYPCLPICLPQFIHVVPLLSMFTSIYPRFIPFTHV